MILFSDAPLAADWQSYSEKERYEDSSSGQTKKTLLKLSFLHCIHYYGVTITHRDKIYCMYTLKKHSMNESCFKERDFRLPEHLAVKLP